MSHFTFVSSRLMIYAPFFILGKLFLEKIGIKSRLVIETINNLSIASRMDWNKIILSIYPIPVFLTPLPLICFTNEEITSCTIEAAKSANKVPRDPASCFFISGFIVLVFPSINTSKFSNDFVI